VRVAEPSEKWIVSSLYLIVSQNTDGTKLSVPGRVLMSHP